MGSSDGLNLKDRWLASAGFDVEVSSSMSAGLTYDYREAAASSASDAHEFSPWLSIRTGGGFRVQPYGILGASDGSPDYGVGLRLSWSIQTGELISSSKRSELPSRTDQVN
jgi:hypothetical protein